MKEKDTNKDRVRKTEQATAGRNGGKKPAAMRGSLDSYDFDPLPQKEGGPDAPRIVESPADGYHALPGTPAEQRALYEEAVRRCRRFEARHGRPIEDYGKIEYWNDGSVGVLEMEELDAALEVICVYEARHLAEYRRLAGAERGAAEAVSEKGGVRGPTIEKANSRIARFEGHADPGGHAGERDGGIDEFDLER